MQPPDKPSLAGMGYRYLRVHPPSVALQGAQAGRNLAAANGAGRETPKTGRARRSQRNCELPSHSHGQKKERRQRRRHGRDPSIVRPPRPRAAAPYLQLAPPSRDGPRPRFMSSRLVFGPAPTTSQHRHDADGTALHGCPPPSIARRPLSSISTFTIAFDPFLASLRLG